MCYGYGLSVSPLQILMAGCALANGGKLMQPYLVRKIFNDQGALLQEFQPKVRAQVISEETSAMMRDVLKGVITSGTAQRAKLDGDVEAFGKTGTARKLIGGKYDPKRHYASFMGFFPADHPQYGILFMLDDPEGDREGGQVAAPLFKQVGDAILRYQRPGWNAGGAAPPPEQGHPEWLAGGGGDALVPVESGKVPDLVGLPLKFAIRRVILAGGTPRMEQPADPGAAAFRVEAQDPPAGTPLAPDAPVFLKARAP
jgi:hypothetical protein